MAATPSLRGMQAGLSAFVVLAVLLFPRAGAADCGDQTLSAVMADVTGIADSVNWRTVGSGVTVQNPHPYAMPVMLVTSFESGSNSSGERIAEYRLTSGTTAVSPVLARWITNSGDFGIGSLVTVSHTPANSSSIFYLQHRRTDSYALRLTSGTLLALPLVTSSGHQLAWAMARQTTEFGSTNAGSYEEVSGSRIELTLAMRSDVYLVSSANVRRSAGLDYLVGEWCIVWRKKGEVGWNAAGDSVQISLPKPEYRSMASATALVESLPAGQYEFALGFRLQQGTYWTVTENATLVGVALSLDVEGSEASFPAFQVSGQHTTTSETYEPALAHSVTLEEGSRMYLGAQYGVQATAASEGTYQLRLGDDGQLHPQRSFVASDTDVRNGASVWLATAEASGDHRVTLAQRRSAGEAEVTLEGTLLGVQLTSICGLPSSVVMGSFTARSSPGGIVLRWQSGSELGVAGFRLQRSESLDGPRIDLAFVPADGSLEGRDYAWTDRDVLPGRHYYYRVECLGNILGGDHDAEADTVHWPLFQHLPLTLLRPF
jgi:hypothetical protein